MIASHRPPHKPIPDWLIFILLSAHSDSNPFLWNLRIKKSAKNRCISVLYIPKKSPARFSLWQVVSLLPCKRSWKPKVLANQGFLGFLFFGIFLTLRKICGTSKRHTKENSSQLQSYGLVWLIRFCNQIDFSHSHEKNTRNFTWMHLKKDVQIVLFFAKTSVILHKTLNWHLLIWLIFYDYVVIG